MLQLWGVSEKEDLDGEVWKTITWANNYQISNKGRLKVLEYKKGSHYKKEDYPLIMKQGFNTKKYCVSAIVDNHKKRTPVRIHRLVGEFFIPNINNLEQLNHLDGIKQNNNLENLEWISNADNMRHSYAIGLRIDSSKGINNGRCILTEEEVIYIYLNPQKLSYAKLSKMFNVGKSTISSIIKGKNWKHITKDLNKQKEEQKWKY